MKLIPDNINAFLQFDDVIKMNERIEAKTVELISGIETLIKQLMNVTCWKSKRSHFFV